MSDIKHSLAQVDSEIVQDLLRISQSALNHPELLPHIAQETSLSEDHLTILAGLTKELLESDGARPSISTIEELNSASNDLARNRAAF